MHGYTDSVHVPLHLPPHLAHPAAAGSSSSSAGSKGKGKAKANHVIPSASSSVPSATYDIVQAWTPEEHAEMRRKVLMAHTLGYSTLLLTVEIPATCDPSILVFPTPLFPNLDPRTAPHGAPDLVLQLWRVTVAPYSDAAVQGAGQKGWYGFANATAPLYPPHTTLLAVSPTSLPAFTHVALSLAPPSPFSPTLVTLDPSAHPRLPFPLKRGLVSALARAGLGFELVLRGLTRLDLPGVDAPADASRRRRNWIAGAREVVRATEGRGVVLSSGAHRAGEMRAPQDWINLCSLIGLPPSQAKDTLTVNPQRAILRGLSLRQTYRGVLSNPTLLSHSTLTDGKNPAPTEIAPGPQTLELAAPHVARSTAASAAGREDAGQAKGGKGAPAGGGRGGEAQGTGKRKRPAAEVVQGEGPQTLESGGESGPRVDGAMGDGTLGAKDLDGTGQDDKKKKKKRKQ